MKRRIAAVLLAMTIGAVIAGCATSGDSSAETATPAIDTTAMTDNTAMDDSYDEPSENQVETETIAPDNMETEEAPVAEPTLDEVLNDVLNYVEREGMIIVDEDSINDLIELMYIAEGPDALNIFNQLCADGQIVTAPVEPEGIIVFTYNGSNVAFSYKEGETVTISLDCINPDNGYVSHLRTFYFENANRCYPAFNGLSVNATQARMHFNSDFTQMTAMATLEDGSVHVGWIDKNGKFTDVSALVTADAGDFGGLTNHSYPCFGPGGYFYFRDETSSNVQVKRAPLDNLTVSAVETLIEKEHYKAAILSPLPNGTAEDDTDKWFYYNEEMAYPARGGCFADWISPSECVGVEGNIIYKYNLRETTRNIFTWNDEKTALIPDIKGRNNWGIIVSPDASRIAFLSALTEGTDTAPYLYTVPISGGDPTKVSTDFYFDGRVNYENFSRGFRSSCLIAWK